MTQHGEEAILARRAETPDLRLATDPQQPRLDDTPPPRSPAVPDGPPPESLPPEGPPPVPLAEGELPPDRSQAILEAAKRVGALLKKKEHRFALAGSVAAYAHGVSKSLQHDADFCVRPQDAEAVAATLAEAGIEVRTPPEDWLIKATCYGQNIDIIFELAQQPVSAEMLDRAEEVPVDSVRMPVLSPTDLVRSLLSAFSEHHCDFGAVLPIARALRERVDWERVRDDCGDAPMSAAFLFLLERLNVIAPRKEQS
ncbi:nucleotidyltransferase family protein [Streptomyces sp. DH24]|uniref:nucleotidyltransferase family protein n=1 Tax=Streptomyces sp. DH24 TaxID=3040123 RepID=UPI002441CCA0|nr:nucleotidyltransferase family protein [Streptomyces sp. DH24]MDG9719897.1 nucleotidyltransferase family protein [Streptomyces sp. DH24]